MTLYDIAKEVTDEVMGAGTYASVNKGNPDPEVQAAIATESFPEAPVSATGHVKVDALATKQIAKEVADQNALVKSGHQIIIEHFNMTKCENEEVRGEFLGMEFPEKKEPKIIVKTADGTRKIGLDFANFVRKNEAEVIPISRVTTPEGDAA